MAISFCCSKITELEEELKVVSNNMKSLEIAEQEARLLLLYFFYVYYLPSAKEVMFC